MTAALAVLCVALVLLNAWTQLVHARERRAHDAEVRRYVSTALVAVDTQRGNAAAVVAKAEPRKRPEPTGEVIHQIDL